MIPKLYTETEVARCLHRERRWLLDWLCEHPTDVHGRPFYIQAGRSKRFTGDDVMRLIDHILTLEEGDRPRSTGEGLIYFVEGGENIKIGFTRSLEARMFKMRTDMPGATVLLTVPGSFQTEKELHRHFAADRVRGEWFRKSPALMAFIEQRRGLA